MVPEILFILTLAGKDVSRLAAGRSLRSCFWSVALKIVFLACRIRTMLISKVFCKHYLLYKGTTQR